MGRVGLSETDVVVVGGEFSLSSSSSSRIGVFCWNSHLQVFKRCRWKEIINARSKTSVYIQLIIFPVEFNIVQISRHMIPACAKPFSAPTLGSNSSLISCVPCWLGVTGTRARWLFENCCLWDSNKLQAARGNSFELIIFSWTRSFTVRVTESGPKSRDHSIPLLETAKIMLL